MNTTRSVVVGWVAYTAAFVVGGGIGLYKYKYAPGGRRDREIVADKLRQEEAVREAEEEDRVRKERKLSGIDAPAYGLTGNQLALKAHSQSQEQ